jgi:hypothetical protein
MLQGNGLDSVILQEVEERGTCTVDDLRQCIPGSTWNHVLTGVSRLAQEGRLRIRQTVNFDYLVSRA